MIDLNKKIQKAYDDGYKARDKEIVRCKDCKWQQTCGYISTKTVSERKNWFCADGEKG